MAAEHLLDGPAEGGELGQALVQVPERDGGAGAVELVDAREIEAALGVGVGERVVLGAQLAGGIDEEHVGVARRRRGEEAVDGGDAEERREARGIIALDEQRLALVVGLGRTPQA